MKMHPLVVICAVLCGGCAVLPNYGPAAVSTPVSGAAVLASSPITATGQSAAALDTTTAAERAAAVAPPDTGTGTDLGAMVVALGSPAEQGFWLSSGAVRATGKGRVVTGSGASVAVDLRPGIGGALLSLAAFRALGLGLTDLPQVRVFAD